MGACCAAAKSKGKRENTLDSHKGAIATHFVSKQVLDHGDATENNIDPTDVKLDIDMNIAESTV